MSIYSENFFITLSDVDENNKLTNKGILRMLQEVACIHCSTLGFGLNNTKSNGLFWIILNWKLQVFDRPIWNTKLKINTWSRKHNSIYFYRDFEVLDENNNLIALATSKWVLFDFIKNSIFKVTDDFNNKFCGDYNKYVFDEPMAEKINKPNDCQFIKSYSVSKRDIDANHHVNNLNYLDFAYELLPENCIYNNVEIMYKREAKLGDTIDLFLSQSTNSHYVVMQNTKTNQLCCIVKLY